MMKTLRIASGSACLALAAALGVVSIAPAVLAQGTKQWTTDRYDAFQRGTADGVAIRNDGQLERGLAIETLYTAEESFVWSVAEGSKGDIYMGVGGDRGGSAAVLRLGPDRSAKKIFSGKELGAQAIRVTPEGMVFTATSPDGRVYRMNADGSGQQVAFDPATTSERSKYIWDLAVASNGTLFVATGAPAAVYRVSPGASTRPELLFRTSDAHIRSLLLTHDGTLWAGSDGAGILYKIDTRKSGATPFAAFAAGHREITSLAMDEKGAVYAAAVGLKGPTSLPPIPVTGAVGVSITLLQPGSTSAAGTNGIVPDGSEIDRVDPDGRPERLSAFKDDVVYSLAFNHGQLLAATGNRGRIYRVDVNTSGRVMEVAHVDAGQATALTAGASGVIVASSNGAKILRLLDPSPKSTFTSEVFDAGQYARWGRGEVQASGGKLEVFVRTGNVPNTIQGWSDWSPIFPSYSPDQRTGIVAGRFAQWRAELHEDAVIHSVTLNYLPRNVAPVIDDIAVVNGARVASVPTVPQPTIQISLPSSGPAIAQAPTFIQQDTGIAPLTAQKDRSGIVIRWSAHDDNNDDLMFAVWYRGVGETTWRLLKEKISDRFLSFDASLLPDGPYEAKVIVSDAPFHTDAEALQGERVSEVFTVDTTPPIPGSLTARIESGLVHWSFEARDATSPIAHAEVSIDAGEWHYVEPIGHLSDSKQERYDVVSALPKTAGAVSGAVTNTAEHTLAVRVYDRAENMASAKTLVH